VFRLPFCSLIKHCRDQTVIAAFAARLLLCAVIHQLPAGSTDVFALCIDRFAHHFALCVWQKPPVTCDCHRVFHTAFERRAQCTRACVDHVPTQFHRSLCFNASVECDARVNRVTICLLLLTQFHRSMAWCSLWIVQRRTLLLGFCTNPTGLELRPS